GDRDLRLAAQSAGALVRAPAPRDAALPLVHLFYHVKITGISKLETLRGPVLFTPNHCLHWDNGIIIMAIPLRWRWKLAVAAAADDVFGNRLNGLASAILANAFPLAREARIRR